MKSKKKEISTCLLAAMKAIGAKGGIIILQSDDGVKIGQIGLDRGEIQENLCLAIHYAKKIELDEQYKIEKAPLN